jgi:hypothetical protein
VARFGDEFPCINWLMRAWKPSLLTWSARTAFSAVFRSDFLRVRQ